MRGFRGSRQTRARAGLLGAADPAGGLRLRRGQNVGLQGPAQGGGGEGGRRDPGRSRSFKGKGSEVGREREGREALALRAFQRVKYSYQGFI